MLLVWKFHVYIYMARNYNYPTAVFLSFVYRFYHDFNQSWIIIIIIIIMANYLLIMKVQLYALANLQALQSKQNFKPNNAG